MFHPSKARPKRIWKSLWAPDCSSGRRCKDRLTSSPSRLTKTQEVQDFYDKERMKAAGWTPNEKGCVADSEDQKSQGALCLFSRKSGDQQEGLAIVIAQDEKTKQTQIFYARVQMPEPSPSPSRR